MRSCLLVLCTAWMVICARGLPTTTDTVFSLFPESEATRVSTTTFIANATETETVPATFVSTTFTSVETTFTPTNTRSPKSETLVPNLNAIGWTTSTPRQLCGRRTTRNGRIVGGDDTFPGDFPWAVSVRIVTVHHCGGTIINKYWVLTAAHCVKRYNARYFRVRPGILDVHEDKYLPKVDINVQEIVVHPDFGNPRRYSNDVALLKLKRPILFNLLTQPICLPLLRGEDFDGWNATVVGWGWLDEEEKERPTSLQRVTVPVLNNTICEKWYSEDYNGYVEIQDYQICAGYKEGGKDACRGDSGGPLVTKDRDNHFIIIGVVSAGVGCARKNLPGIYSRVSFFVPWILQVTGGFNGL